MPEILMSVGRHLFSPDALQKALDEAIPKMDLQPGQRGGALASVDADGVKVALQITSEDTHWRVRMAYAHDWTGDDKIAGDVLYRF